MDTHWDEVTQFGKLIERGGKAQKGDLVHITGRVRQNSYDTAEGRRYTVELIADGFAVLAKGSEDRDKERSVSPTGGPSRRRSYSPTASRTKSAWFPPSRTTPLFRPNTPSAHR